jgi:hypothetical protein
MNDLFAASSRAQRGTSQDQNALRFGERSFAFAQDEYAL